MGLASSSKAADFTASPENRVYPYLLEEAVTRPDQVWCTDVTYIPASGLFVPGGDHALVQPLGFVLEFCRTRWSASFCCEALEEALKQVRPRLFTDQGSQF